MTDEQLQPNDKSEPVEDADDTEGHSLQIAEFSRTVARDRAREAEAMARESRMREQAKGKKSGRSLFRR